MTKKRLQIQGMHCAGCKMAVEGALEDLPGVNVANANYAKQFADVEYDETQLTDAQLLAAVKEAGYQASIAS